MHKDIIPNENQNSVVIVTSYKLKVNDKITSDKTEIANGFCLFFQSVASTLKQASIKLKDFKWSKPTRRRPNSNVSFRFNHVSVPEVKK